MSPASVVMGPHEKWPSSNGANHRACSPTASPKVGGCDPRRSISTPRELFQRQTACAASVSCAKLRTEAITEGRKEGVKEGRKEGITEGRKEGITEGRKEGIRAGERSLLLRQLHARFGELPDAVVARIEAADMADLERWGERVLGAQTLDEVLDEPS